MAEFGRQLADLVMMPQSSEPAPTAPALPPGTPEMKPYDPTMRERMAGALQTGMEKLGMDRYKARQRAQTFTGGQSSVLPGGMGFADVLPYLGTALQSQEAVRGGEAAMQSAKEGDLIGAGVEAGFAALNLIPGAVATKKAIQQSRKIPDRTIPVPLREPEGVTYATSQEGPFYRVRPNVTEAAPRQGRGTKESVGPAPTIGGPAGGNVPQPITDEAVQQVIQQPDNFVRRIADEYSLTNTGSPYELPEIPQSSLLKQAPIGRVFGLAATDDPTYKRVVFDSYARQYPQLLEQSGAQNYDQLLEAAYRQLAQETEQQFRKLPINMSYHRAGEGNYENSKELLRDIYGNRHMYVFQGGDPHDFLNKVDPATGLNTNEMFRAVHDFFGHAIHGNQFGPKGEEIAWAAHSQMFSPLARLAMTAETRGQNSFVNYTPINAELKAEIARLNGEAYEASRRGNTKMLDEINKDLKEAWSSFQFAPQKSVILPPEFLDLNYAGGMPRAIQPLVRPQAGTTTEAQLTHFSQQPGLTVTDPAMYGTGIKGEELARLQGEPGAVMERSYFYAGDPSRVRPEPGLGPYRYGAQSSELYDIAADPLQLGTLARESQRIPYTAPSNKGLLAGDPATDLERLVKEYGYEGLINPNLSQPTAIMFKPKEVRPFKKGGKVSEEPEESRPSLPNPELLKYMSLDDLVNPLVNFPKRYPGQTVALPSDSASDYNKEVQDRRLKQGAIDAVDWATKNLPQPVNPVMQSLRNILDMRKRKYGGFHPDVREAAGLVDVPEEFISIGQSGNQGLQVPRFAKGGGVKELVKEKLKEALGTATKAEVPEQKMLQGFYRGYAGDYDATKSAAQDSGVYVSPQRRVGEFYSEKRAAQTGQDPHVEMILADPFSGREYGHATSGTGRNPPIMTRARELAPEDVKGRTQLKKSGGKVAFTDNIDAMKLHLARGGGIKEKVKSAIKEAVKPNAVVKTYKTTDGYTFYELGSGKIVDNKKPSQVDMSWPNRQEFMTDMEGTAFEVGDELGLRRAMIESYGVPTQEKLIENITQFGEDDITKFYAARKKQIQDAERRAKISVVPKQKSSTVARENAKESWVDPSQEKHVVYHGTNKDITTFEKSLTPDDHVPGISVTDDPISASGYAEERATKKSAGEGANVLPLYVRTEKPMPYPELESWTLNKALEKGFPIKDPEDFAAFDVPPETLVQWLKEEGYDAIDYRSDPMLGYGLRVFEPNQLKSAIANKTFDPENLDITKAAGGYVSLDPIGNDLRSILGLKVGGDVAKAKAKEKLKQVFTPKQVEKTAEKMADKIKKDNPKLTDEQVMAKATKEAEQKLKWEKVEKPELEKKFGPLQKAPYSAPLSARQKNVPEVVEKRVEETKRFLEQPTEPWTPPPKELQAFDRALIKDAMEGFPGVEQTRFPRYVPPRSDLSYIEEIYGDPVNRALIEGQIKRGLPLGGETFYASLYPLKVAALERGIPEEKFNQFIYSIAPASARNSIFNEMAVGQFLRDMHARGLPLDEATVNLERAKFKEKFGVGLPLMPVHREGVASVLQGPQNLREMLIADIPTNYKIPTYGTQKAGDFGQSMVLDVHEAAGQTRGSPYHPYFTEQGGFGPTEYGAAESQMLDIAQGLGLPGGTAQAGRWFGGGELTGLKSPRGDALDLLERQTAYTLYNQGIAPTPRNIRNTLLDMIETGEGLFMPWYKKEGMPDLRTVKKKGGAVKKRKVKITDSKDAQMLALLKKG